MSDWQPIETAPKDGTLIIGCLAPWDYVNVVYYTKVDGTLNWFNPCDEVICNPTHWMPLPEPPAL